MSFFPKAVSIKGLCRMKKMIPVPWDFKNKRI